MSDLTRRGFLRAAAAMGGAALVSAALPDVVEAAAGNDRRRHGDLRDVEHVVIVMQENRSFDHYFGTMKGVRGFGDRSTIMLPGGKTVWEQPQTPTVGASTQFPWRLSGTNKYAGATPPSPELGAANYPGTRHGWD